MTDAKKAVTGFSWWFPIAVVLATALKVAGHLPELSWLVLLGGLLAPVAIRTTFVVLVSLTMMWSIMRHTSQNGKTGA